MASSSNILVGDLSGQQHNIDYLLENVTFVDGLRSEFLACLTPERKRWMAGKKDVSGQIASLVRQVEQKVDLPYSISFSRSESGDYEFRIDVPIDSLNAGSLGYTVTFIRPKRSFLFFNANLDFLVKSELSGNTHPDLPEGERKLIEEAIISYMWNKNRSLKRMRTLSAGTNRADALLEDFLSELSSQRKAKEDMNEHYRSLRAYRNDIARMLIGIMEQYTEEHHGPFLSDISIEHKLPDSYDHHSLHNSFTVHGTLKEHPGISYLGEFTFRTPWTSDSASKPDEDDLSVEKKPQVALYTPVDHKPVPTKDFSRLLDLQFPGYKKSAFKFDMFEGKELGDSHNGFDPDTTYLAIASKVPESLAPAMYRAMAGKLEEVKAVLENRR